MKYLALLFLAGCAQVTEVSPGPCDHGNRKTYYAAMPSFAATYVCTKLNAVEYSPACTVWNDREAVIVHPMGDESYHPHEQKHARCGHWHRF